MVKRKTPEKEAKDLLEGEEVRWTDLNWYKVLESKTVGGWTYLKLEDAPKPRECSIISDIELMWR